MYFYVNIHKDKFTIFTQLTCTVGLALVSIKLGLVVDNILTL